MTASAWVDLLIQRGPELRGAGILRVSAEGCSAVIAPQLPEVAQGDNRTLPVEDIDPLADPVTFGGGPVPGIVLPEQGPADEEQAA